MNTRRFLLILIGLAFLSCSHKKQVQFQKPPSSPAPSNSNSLPESSKSNSPKAHNLLPLLSEIDVLDPPKGVTPELFSKLKAELEKIILERRNASLAGEKVAAQMGASPVLFVSQGKLSWEEVREGDWNNDGIVKADDILPLAISFGKSDDPASSDYYKYAKYIDGDGDGIIGLGDIQAIADHFGESTEGYSIYEALDEAGLSSSKVATVLRPSPPADPDNPPWNISFSPLGYDSKSAPTIPPNWTPTPGKYYSVIPYGQGFDEQGEPIFVERFNLASNWVYINIPPVAVLKATPDTGEAPMTVEFDASESYDADGYVTNYVWDFDGDGLTDKVTQTPVVNYEFTGPSINPAKLLVYDSTGASSPQATLSLHIAGFLWEQVPIGVSGLYLTILNGDITLAGVREKNIVLVRKKNNQWEEEKVVEAPPPVGGGNSPSVVGVTTLQDGRTFVVWQDKDFHVQFALYNGRRWTNAVWISDRAQAPRLALSTAGVVGVVYYDMDEDLLKYFSWDGAQMITELVDTELYAGRYGASISFDNQGNPVVAYRTTQNPELVLAKKSGDEWVREVIFTDPSQGLGPELVIGYDMNIYIVYMDVDFLELSIHWKSGTIWDQSVLDRYSGSQGGHFSRTSSKISLSNVLNITYVENDASDIIGYSKDALKLIRFTQGQWTLLSARRADLYINSAPSLTLGEDGLPIVALMAAYKRPSEYPGIYVVRRVE